MLKYKKNRFFRVISIFKIKVISHHLQLQWICLIQNSIQHFPLNLRIFFLKLCAPFTKIKITSATIYLFISYCSFGAFWQIRVLNFTLLSNIGNWRVVICVNDKINDNKFLSITNKWFATIMTSRFTFIFRKGIKSKKMKEYEYFMLKL